MSLWIKICGNTSLADAQLAADAGADAVGFVFAPSPRRVTVDQVAVITPHLPPQLEKIGVFVDASADEIVAAVVGCGLTGVQIHFGANANLAHELRERIGADVRILQVLHFDPDAALIEERLREIRTNSAIDGILVDSRTATAPGGTGIAFDWHTARATIFRDSSMKLIAAGGLNPANVAEAIRILRPWGVDVVSGVEASPGRKDPAKVKEFVEVARQATLRS